MFLALFMTVFAADFTEDFGTLQTTGCASPWDGDCEYGWDSTGLANTLAICEDTGEEYYLVLEPSSDSQFSGISRVVSLVAGDHRVEWGARAHVETAGTVRMVVDFLDASDTVISTVNADRTVSPGVYDMALHATAPVAATAASLRFGLKGLGTQAAVEGVWLQSHSFPASPLACSARADLLEDKLADICENNGGNQMSDAGCTGTPDVDGPDGCSIACDALFCRYDDDTITCD